ncbi:MAG: nucleotide sugar dehydrogenase [Bdellovibrionales bacterium]|nr:nucleotide sugar dehydrogenase [Bdellovibrionales bacterium]
MEKPTISVVGLGYVGLPVAIEMSKKFRVIGFDISKRRIQELKNNYDRTREVAEDDLKSSQIEFTCDERDLENAKFHILAVPTPVNDANQPDLTLLLSASATVGRHLKKGDLVVYESTVYPGATEEDCLPILERESKLKAGSDFKVGYSPERINPGDKEHTFTKITKVVSAQDEESLERVAFVYGSVVTAGVHRAPTIKTAEASKVIENAQRDINVAFMNELSIIFELMDINTSDVLNAARTKWNFLNFYPGLVGGHCIGVDPFYLTYKAKQLGHHPDVILAGRRINDQMGQMIARKLLQMMILNGIDASKASVNLLGLTFKENCPDTRNSKVKDIYLELKEYGVKVNICDPVALEDEVEHEFGVTPTKIENLAAADAMIVAVGHDYFAKMSDSELDRLLKERAVMVDVKAKLKERAFSKKILSYWSL